LRTDLAGERRCVEGFDEIDGRPACDETAPEFILANAVWCNDAEAGNHNTSTAGEGTHKMRLTTHLMSGLTLCSLGRQHNAFATASLYGSGIANWPKRPACFLTLRVTRPSGRKLWTLPTRRHEAGRPLSVKSVRGPIAGFPARADTPKSAEPMASGETIPRPVITTPRRLTSDLLCSWRRRKQEPSSGF